MPIIKNNGELNSLMEKIISDIILSVAGKISNMLQEQIERDVYTTPNEWYERTEEFEKAWKWTDVKKNINRVVTELYYDSSGVHWNKKWEHGNPGRSAAENLADILNLAFNNYRDGYTSSLKFGDRHFSHFRRPYWNNLIEKLFEKGELDKMFDAEFKARGLIRVK